MNTTIYQNTTLIVDTNIQNDLTKLTTKLTKVCHEKLTPQCVLTDASKLNISDHITAKQKPTKGKALTTVRISFIGI